MPLCVTSDGRLFYNDRTHTSRSDSTTGLRGGGGGVESCLRRLDTGDAADLVGVIAPIEDGLGERAMEDLLLAREITLALENESCELICEVFRISLPESLMIGLNISITCCKVEFEGAETE